MRQLRSLSQLDPVARAQVILAFVALALSLIASAYIGLTAGGVHHLTPLPWGDLAIIALATPLLATLAAWVLGGKEPIQIARSPLD